MLGFAMSMAMHAFGRVLVAVHYASPPTDEEWECWLALARKRHGLQLRALAETHGNSGPNARQRQTLASQIAGCDVRTAILTESAIMRGVVTAIGWLGVSLRAFPHGHYRDATAYLDLSDAEVASMLEALPELRKECGMVPL